MNPKDSQAMVDAIAENLGFLGMDEISMGSLTIKAKELPTLTECVGAGETIRVGDVVIDHYQASLQYPNRIAKIMPSRGTGLGPSILSDKVDDADPHGGTSYLAWGAGWCRDFQVLNQADVDAWFAKDKALRPNGWHKLPHLMGRVRVIDGAPTELERASASPYHNIKKIVGMAEQMLGFDITPCRTYENPEKTRVKVRKAVRRNPPKV